MTERGFIRTIVSAACALIAAACFISVVVIQRNTSRQDYIANCLHTNAGIHLLLDGPIQAAITANRKALADPSTPPDQRAIHQTSLTAELTFEANVNHIYSAASCGWPPVSLVPALTSTTTAKENP